MKVKKYSCKKFFPMVRYTLTSQNKNALKRNSKFPEVFRELLAGEKQQRKGSELVSKQLAEPLVGVAGAWPLTDRRVSTYVRTCQRACLFWYEQEW